MLLVLAAVPVVISALLGLIAPRVGSRMLPATAVKVLAPAALAAALATGFCLSVLAFNALARVAVIARFGHWRSASDPDDGTPPPIGGLLLALLVTVLVITAVCHVLRAAVRAVRAGSTCRQLPASRDRIVIVDDSVADAFAVPGLPSRIVITSGMLGALDDAEREVLLAHERAHLNHHHQLLVQLANVAASADPLLISVARQVQILTERWADEEAAAAVDDRRLAARTVAKAALARTASTRAMQRRFAATLSATSTGVIERVRALNRPQPRPQRRLAGALAGLAIIGLLASAGIAHTTDDKFDHAAAPTIHAPVEKG